MSLRAVLVVVAFMLVAGISAYVALNNHMTLGLKVTFPGGWSPEVYKVVALSFLLGFALTAVLVSVRSVQLAVGRFKESREARERERVERRYSQGLEALLGGGSARAEERFRDVLARNPDHLETLMTYGEMLRGLGRAREAADLHRRAADLRPGDMRPWFALAADWQAEGDVEKAREALEMVIAAKTKAANRARRELRELLIQHRRFEDARRAHEAIETEEGAKERPEEERAREKRIGLGIRYEIARAAQAKDELREAEKEYRVILKADPAFIPASLALGETLVQAGSAEEGVKAWRRGYEASKSPMFFARLEEHHLSREEPETIIRLMRSLVESAPSRLLPGFYLAKLYLRLEMIDEAEATFASVQNLADTPAVRYYNAMIMERRGRLKEAASAYRKVIEDAMVLKPRFHCRSCKVSLVESSARCPKCGDWSTVDVDVRDLLSAEQEGTMLPPWVAGA